MWLLVTNLQSEFDLDRLPDSVRQEAVKAILELKHDPFPPGHVKLTGYINHYRVRFYRNAYRLVYQVSLKNKRIVILRVAHRNDVYRGMVHNPALTIRRRKFRLHPT